MSLNWLTIKIDFRLRRSGPPIRDSVVILNLNPTDQE